MALRPLPPLPAILLLAALAQPACGDQPPCDLTGSWLVNVRTNTGGTPPASTASVLDVLQTPLGLFTAHKPGGNQVWTGKISSNRHVEVWPPPPPSTNPGIGLLSASTPINCSTEASCKATCTNGGSQCSDGVYYCCDAGAGCNGLHDCPTNKGLAACACNPPPPPPLTRMNGTAQPGCQVILWECGLPFSHSCEGAQPRATWHRVDAATKVVHVVYMSHFDAGYTHDTSLEVLQQYYTEWFPKAYNTSRELKARGGPEQFHWTSHPWLIDQLFANLTGNVTNDMIRDMEAAIQEGIISWHAAPMNLQAETADTALYAFGLGLSDRLDARFNKTGGGKTSISQKDVPGSTVGMIPIAARSNVRSFHVGVNDFSTPPAVPFTTPGWYEPCNTFLWRAPTAKGSDGPAAELVCFWCSGYSQGYGTHAGLIPEMLVSLTPFGGDHALAFLMTVDNSGPQSVDEVLEGWRNLRLMFPNATIIDSSLEAFTEHAWEARGNMSVITAEIGDTWIRGSASDPTKARRYRVVARAIAAAVGRGEVFPNDPRIVAAYDQLIKLPEHTYGSSDGLIADLPFDNAYLDSHINNSNFQATASGWLDQRAYIDRAVAALSDLPLRSRVDAELLASEPAPVPTAGLAVWPLGVDGAPVGTVQCGGVTLGLDSAGAISTLVVTGTGNWTNGRIWADANHTLGRFRYLSHSQEEFDTFGDRYMMPGCRSDTTPNLCGFGKSGLNAAGAEAREWQPIVTAAWRTTAAAQPAGCQVVVALAFPAQAQAKYGAPSIANVTVTVGTGPGTDTANGTTLSLDVQYHKRHTRMAESLWFSFAPRVLDAHGWRLDKLGISVDPFDVAINGSRAMHAIWDGIAYHEPAPPAGHQMAGDAATPALAIASVDASVVAVDTPSPIVFLRDEQINGSSFHFNLFNNAWNTNYPLWEVDTSERFRFELVFR